MSAVSLHAAVSPALLPAPGPQGWVVDRAGILPTATVAELNALGDAVHARDGAMLAVVVVDSTGAADHRAFATELFNRWGLGSRARDNGVLLFVAIDDRACEIVLGDGIDSDAEVAASDRIMSGTIVPLFKNGRHAAAITAGARACADRFFGVRSAGATAGVEDAAPLLEAPDSGALPADPPARRTPWWPFAVGGGGVIGGLGWMVGRSIARHRPRRCRHCAMTMQRLDENADDAHLADTERTEERVGSVDYDVWSCPGCNAVEKLRYGRWFTRYSQCPLCGGFTKHSKDRTLRSATTSSTGLVEVNEKCAHCAYSKTYTRTTPRLSSSSSSSSSSGRSSGGGSSSGRGSSGRW